MIKLNVTGVEQAIKRLNELEIKVHTKILRAGVNEITTELDNRITSAAPVGITKSMASLKWGPIKDNVNVTAARISNRIKKIRATVLLPFYWRFVELGTTIRKTKKGANRGSIHKDVRRFVHPVIETFGANGLKIFTDKIASEITKLGKRK